MTSPGVIIGSGNAGASCANAGIAEAASRTAELDLLSVSPYAKEAISGIYQAGLDNVQKMAAGS